MDYNTDDVAHEIQLRAGLRYRTYAADELATSATAPPNVTEITQNHKSYDCLENIIYAS